MPSSSSPVAAQATSTQTFLDKVRSFFSPPSSSSSSTEAAAAAPPPAVMLIGDTAPVAAAGLAARGVATLDVTLIAFAPGVQRLPPLRLLGPDGGAPLDVLSAWVCVGDGAEG